MKMSENTLLKKIDQACKENYCTGSYSVEIENSSDEETRYVLYYTYETGEVISLYIDATQLVQIFAKKIA